VALPAGGDVERWIAEFFELEAKGWKGRRGSALKSRPEDRRFAAEVFAAAFRRGRLLAIGIDLEGKPLSRLFGFTAGAGSFVFKTAYDEDYAKFSPGAMVEVEWIRRIHELAAVRWTDSYTSPGNEMIKRLWKDCRAIQRIAVGVGARGELALAALPLARWVKRRLRRG
jgi:CelD/BcsL family acetyltransferase involved in cellulose biosynthesis